MSVAKISKEINKLCLFYRLKDGIELSECLYDTLEETEGILASITR